MHVSIVIPSYNSQNTINDCLETISKQNTSAEYEVIVVDSSPHKEVQQIASNFNVKFISLPKQTFPGETRNIGAKEAQGQLLLFIDSDVTVDRKFVQLVYEYYQAGHEVFSCAIGIHENASFVNHLEYFIEFSEFKPEMPEKKCWCLPGYALAVDSTIFSQHFFANTQSSEDTDLTIRLRNNGMTLFFCPHIEIKHIFQSSLLGVVKKMYKFGISNIALRFHHDVSGSKFIANPLTKYFIMPVFAAAKFTKISLRNLKYNSMKAKFKYLLLLPFVTVCMCSWMLGGYKCIWKNGNN